MDGAIVLLEGLLGQAVEGEGGDCAVEMRGSHAPAAVRAAPAAEVIAIDPDQAFVHTSTFYVLLGFELGRGGTEYMTASSAVGELLPAAKIFSTKQTTGKVTKGLRPRGQRPTRDFSQFQVTDFA